MANHSPYPVGVPRAGIGHGKFADPSLSKARPITMAAGLAVWATVLTMATGVGVAQEHDGPSIPVIPRRSNQLTSRSNFRIDTKLVLIPVTVTDLYDRPIRGLKKADFRLFEEGVEQDVTQFYAEESPITVGIVFDASGSMYRKMEASRRAISEFLRVCMPGDEFFLLKFSDKPELLSSFTRDIRQIEDNLHTIEPRGWTSLYDAVYLSMNKIKRASHDRKVLLVLSDGGDNDSRYTEKELKELVKEADVRIFSISIQDRSPSLEAIAKQSGGQAFRVRNLEELPDLAANVSAELHSEYVLGFTPPAGRTNDGKYRRVKVQLMRPSGDATFHVSWKRGYYGAAQ